VVSLGGNEESVRCLASGVRNDATSFHISLEPGQIPLPTAIRNDAAGDSKRLPAGLISVSHIPGGHRFLFVGERITFAYTAKNDFPITVEAGTLAGIVLPSR